MKPPRETLKHDPRFPFPVRVTSEPTPELFCLVHHFSVDRHERIRHYELETVKEVGPETWVRLRRNPEPEVQTEP